MTNYEKIKAMSIEEMAKFFDSNKVYCHAEIQCPAFGKCMSEYFGRSCEWCVKKWLESEDKNEIF